MINLPNLDDHKVVHPPKAWSHPPPDPSGAELQPRCHDGGQLFPVTIFYKLLHLHNTGDVDSDGDVAVGIRDESKNLSCKLHTMNDHLSRERNYLMKTHLLVFQLTSCLVSPRSHSCQRFTLASNS